MQITWTDSSGKPMTGRIDARLWPIIEAIGRDKAADLFLTFGGSYIYLAQKRVQAGADLTRLLGEQDALRLCTAITEAGTLSSTYRVPLADVFLARHLRSKGLKVNQICRRLRRSDVSVRGFLKPDTVRRKRQFRRSQRFMPGTSSHDRSPV